MTLHALMYRIVGADAGDRKAAEGEITSVRTELIAVDLKQRAFMELHGWQMFASDVDLWELDIHETRAADEGRFYGRIFFPRKAVR